MKPDCKYPDLHCDFNYVDEFGDPLNKCYHEGGCIFKVYPDENEEWGLQKAFQHSPFWTLWGCDSKKKVVVDETIITVIKAWAGDATEPNSGLYKNPEAMFNALDLIYYLIDEAQEGPVKVSKDKPYSSAPGTWEISQIIPLVTHEKDAYELSRVSRELQKLKEKVNQGALFESQEESDEMLVCPECGTDMLTLDCIELALCPECHDMHSFSICPTKSSFTHERRIQK